METADLTAILDSWSNGDATALERITPLVYPQLREIAAACLRSNFGAPTLQATSLVSELFLKLLGTRPAKFESRRHFYAIAGRLMRHALVDHYRENAARKRGGAKLQRIPFREDLAWIDANSPELLDLDRALDELSHLDSVQAELIGLRFILGCTSEEAASLTGLSKATVDRKVRLGRAWLFRRLGKDRESLTPDFPNE